MRKIILFIFLFFIHTTNVDAAFTLKIDNVSLSEVKTFEDEVLVTASISGLPSESYFRIAWQKSSGDTYFGYLKNNLNEWVKVFSSQDCKNYFKISDTNTTSFGLTTKVGEDSVVENGIYTLKLRRYTSSCSSYSDSDPVNINILFPTPTPTPTIAPTQSPTEAPKTSSPTPTKSPSPTSNPTKKPTPSSLSSPTIEPTQLSEVLGVATIEPKKDNKESKFPFVPVVLIISGIVLMVIAVIQFIRASKKNNPQI